MFSEHFLKKLEESVIEKNILYPDGMGASREFLFHDKNMKAADFNDFYKAWVDFVEKIRFDEKTSSRIQLHMHIPFSQEDKNKYCDSYAENFSSRCNERGWKYLEGVRNMLEKMSPIFRGIKLSSLYIDEDIPSILSEEQIDTLLEAIFINFEFNPSAEKTFESSPSTFTEKKIAICKNWGINRISIKVQSLDKEVLRANGMTFVNYEKIKEIVSYAKSVGISNVNINLFDGMDKQSFKSMADDFIRLSETETDIINIYMFRKHENRLGSMEPEKNLKAAEDFRERFVADMKEIRKIASQTRMKYYDKNIALTNAFRKSDVYSLFRYFTRITEFSGISTLSIGPGTRSYLGQGMEFRQKKITEQNIGDYCYEFRKFGEDEIRANVLATKLFDFRVVPIEKYHDFFNESATERYANTFRFMEKMGWLDDNMMLTEQGNKKIHFLQYLFYPMESLKYIVGERIGIESERGELLSIKNSQTTFVKRADIKTGYLCNNNCIHCVVADKRYQKDRTTEDYKNDLVKSRKDGCNDVVITGGEPTIRRDFFELIDFAKNIGFEKIALQTNGRVFCDKDFSKKAIENGIIHFAVAIHAHTPDIHDSITRVRGSFDQTVAGISNLVAFQPRIAVTGIIVVTKFNYKILPEIAEFLIKLGVRNIQYDFVHPMGNAYKYYDEVVPRMSEAVEYIKKGIEIARKNKVNVTVEAVPFCLMENYEKNIVELYIPFVELRELGRFSPDFNEIKINQGKSKSPICKECKYNNICEGVWKEYPEKMGFDEFVPVKGNIIESKDMMNA